MACSDAHAIESGFVQVSQGFGQFPGQSYGGYKQSGIGRELGKWGVEEYLHVKQVHINLSEQPIGWY